jgi:hypothetical protein
LIKILTYSSKRYQQCQNDEKASFHDG